MLIEERFSDAERQKLVVMVTRALISARRDPERTNEAEQYRSMLRKLTGTDTVLYARRAYSSTASSRSGETLNTTCNS